VYGPKLAILKGVRVLKLELQNWNEFDLLAYVTTGYGYNSLYVVSARADLWFKRNAATEFPIVHPRPRERMEIHGGMKSTSENSWFVHQTSVAILPAVI
jgi:hypothetical protein